jgi:anhydro-N-acetylmuramic acid kinase
MKKIEKKIIGLMSGTSLDGVDLAFCIFNESEGNYDYKIEVAETIAYSGEWKERLTNLPEGNALHYALTHVEYGHYLGKITSQFIEKHGIKPLLVASHGHTVFHQPGNGFTSQIGDGSALSAECNLPVVCDFRSGDLALGGEGAPLVPIGDQYLFSEYDYCLNLGGFSNISFQMNENRLAYDISPVNIVLNSLAKELGYEYDHNGKLAASGHPDPELFDRLNALPFYSAKPPKSLGREWVEQIFLPELKRSDLSVTDQLSTATEHIAYQLARNIENHPDSHVLVTGGGAYNSFLITRLKKYSDALFEIPGSQVIDYKEALIFAFLGLLRYEGKSNCLASVTGARKNARGGCIYLP